MPEAPPFALIAEFDSPEALVAAARRARREGYRELDAFTPFPVEELKSVLRFRDQRVLWLGLGGGVFGAAAALGMQAYTNYDYVIDVGGRPLYAWTAFAVIVFELTVLFAALFPTIGMLALNRLPRLNYPVFAAPRFHLASRDRFFLCIHASDPRFRGEDTARFLTTLGAASVEAVPP
jgi:hypothetical protein